MKCKQCEHERIKKENPGKLYDCWFRGHTCCNCDILGKALEVAHKSGIWNREEFEAMYSLIQDATNECHVHKIMRKRNEV